MQSDAPFDCLIIGGGPAGLVAATYLSRFRRRKLVIDAGDSRAAIGRAEGEEAEQLHQFEEGGAANIRGADGDGRKVGLRSIGA